MIEFGTDTESSAILEFEVDRSLHSGMNSFSVALKLSGGNDPDERAQVAYSVNVFEELAVIPDSLVVGLRGRDVVNSLAYFEVVQRSRNRADTKAPPDVEFKIAGLATGEPVLVKEVIHGEYVYEATCRFGVIAGKELMVPVGGLRTTLIVRDQAGRSRTVGILVRHASGIAGPSVVVFPSKGTKDAVRRRLSLVSSDGVLFRIRSIELEQPSAFVVLSESDSGESRQSVTVETVPGEVKRKSETKLLLRTDHPSSPEIEINLRVQ